MQDATGLIKTLQHIQHPGQSMLCSPRSQMAQVWRAMRDGYAIIARIIIAYYLIESPVIVRRMRDPFSPHSGWQLDTHHVRPRPTGGAAKAAHTHLGATDLCSFIQMPATWPMVAQVTTYVHCTWRCSNIGGSPAPRHHCTTGGSSCTIL